MGTDVDLTAVRYFLHVATAGSFVGGARRAHVSPPAISKAIRKLEGDLGVQLFERTTRRVALTQAGQVALDRCSRVLAELDGLGSDLAHAIGRPTGPLRIAAGEVFSIEVLPQALAALVADHPDVVPRCYEMIPQQMSERLLAGQLDVAFTIAATAAAGIDVHVLGRSPGVVVCGRRHPLRARGRVTAKDLLRYPSAVPRVFGQEHLPSLDQFPDQHYPRRTGATMELLQMGVELVVNGPYLAYFPEISVRRQLAAGRLHALRGLHDLPAFELRAMCRAGVAIKPAAALLIGKVAAALAARNKR